MLKYMDKIIVSFAPLNPKSRSVRAFMQQLITDGNRQSNAKCNVVINMSDKIAKPTVEAFYTNKATLKLDTETLTAAEIVKDVNRLSKRLQLEEDIAQSG
ncbi:hypothetical protein PhCBS80983_g03607 [Powellomyces hirtus]|uniref:Large ribosomal subunit protein mL53 n=1 Tax=Powellomyces hirtus TaxID=109895 RepID=A0A507E0Y0_9FUNG|nr:hypothetical protein PhCBS80983_g03607 [Powellomyces hirtus]